MNVILNKDNVGIFLIAEVTLTEQGVIFEDGGINTEYTTANASSIEAIQPQPPVDFAWKWNGTDWEVYDQQKIDAYLKDQTMLFNANQSKLRKAAYELETDPISFKVIRGEATQEELLAAVNLVKRKYPYK
jgi:hypothetical protein